MKNRKTKFMLYQDPQEDINNRHSLRKRKIKTK